MAIESKLIRVRRGTAAEFEVGKSKIISGEFAVVTDTEEAYFSPQDGKSVRLATEKDVSQLEESIANMGGGSGITFDAITEGEVMTSVEETVKVPATGINLDKTILLFENSSTQILVATVTPPNTTDTVVWTSNNNAVATVTNGLVKPISNGSATITATAGDYFASCNVTVEMAEEEQVTLISISATYTGGNVAVGTELTDLTGITVTATYSDGSTANVADYTLSGEIAEGSNTITVTYEGKTATFTVTGIAESTAEYRVFYVYDLP